MNIQARQREIQQIRASLTPRGKSLMKNKLKGLPIQVSWHLATYRVVGKSLYYGSGNIGLYRDKSDADFACRMMRLRDPLGKFKVEKHNPKEEQ